MERRDIIVSASGIVAGTSLMSLFMRSTEPVLAIDNPNVNVPNNNEVLNSSQHLRIPINPITIEGDNIESNTILITLQIVPEGNGFDENVITEQESTITVENSSFKEDTEAFDLLIQYDDIDGDSMNFKLIAKFSAPDEDVEHTMSSNLFEVNAEEESGSGVVEDTNLILAENNKIEFYNTTDYTVEDILEDESSSGVYYSSNNNYILFEGSDDIVIYNIETDTIEKVIDQIYSDLEFDGIGIDFYSNRFSYNNSAQDSVLIRNFSDLDTIDTTIDLNATAYSMTFTNHNELIIIDENDDFLVADLDQDGEIVQNTSKDELDSDRGDNASMTNIDYDDNNEYVVYTTDSTIIIKERNESGEDLYETVHSIDTSTLDNTDRAYCNFNSDGSLLYIARNTLRVFETTNFTEIDNSPIIENEFENEDGNMENYSQFLSSRLSSNGDLMALTLDIGIYSNPLLIKNTNNWTTEAVVGDDLVSPGDAFDFKN